MVLVNPVAMLHKRGVKREAQDADASFWVGTQIPVGGDALVLALAPTKQAEHAETAREQKEAPDLQDFLVRIWKDTLTL
jgi:hypothetical protein